MSLKEAIARSFEIEIERLGQKDCYFVSLVEELVAKRDYMAKFLSNVGMKVVVPEGGYFMIADWTPLGINSRDIQFMNINTNI